jgi:uncharacterized OB-fold protein
MDPAALEFYRRLAEEASLATTRCEQCEVTAFPPRLRCGQCGGTQVWVELPRTGRLHAFTTQETSLRFGAPTVLALAEVGGVVLPGIVDAPYDSLAIGQEVRVELRDEAGPGLTLLAFETG